MRLPKVLFNSYTQLKKSRVVVKKENDNNAIAYFNNMLNQAQPVSHDDFLIQQFVKNMYNENKRSFLKFIRTVPGLDALILWTDANTIVNEFGLKGVVYIKWTGKDSLYTVSKYQPNFNKEVSDPIDGEEIPTQGATAEEFTVVGKKKSFTGALKKKAGNSAVKPAGITTSSSFEALNDIPTTPTEPVVVSIDDCKKTWADVTDS
jgi:hypothetical protein